MLFDRLIHLRDLEPHSAALNMALDEALLASATGPTIRIYRWEQRAVSFGYFGKWKSVSAFDGDIVRRMTGGGIVEHGEDITYTLVIPASHEIAKLSARDSYREIHAALAAWIASRGIAASLAAAPENGGNGVCFDSPAEADVLSAGRKLAGAAQRRTQHGLLYQASVQGLPDEWRNELPLAFASHIASRDFTATELALAQTIASEKYATTAWTERV